MKRITLALLLLFSVSIVAQQGINYKAVIKDGSGAIAVSTPISLQFIILDGAVPVYHELYSATTDANGIIILNIGEGTPVLGTFSTIDWSSNNHFLNVLIDASGAMAGFEDMGTTAFKAVPYAMYSTTATTATELTGGIDQAYIAALEARIAALEPLAIGDLLGDGVVFWIDPADNRHGLVCALLDYNGFVNYGCSLTDLPSVPNVTITPPTGPGAEIGYGLTNTNGILSDCPGSPAALAARFYGSEWFLPSIKELKEMYYKKAILEAVPGFIPFRSYYWSSTETDYEGAFIQNFFSGSSSYSNKAAQNSVRAVRAF